MRDSPFADPRFVKAFRDLETAVSCDRQGLFDEAEKTYARVVKKNPDYFDALHLYGLFKYKRGQLNDAIKLVTKATKVNPRSANAFNSLGVILAHLGRHGEALTSFDASLKLDPNHVQALGNRCNSLNQFGRYQDAISSSDRVLAIEPNFSEVYLPRGEALLRCKRYAEALESYERAIKLRPNLAVAWLGRGNVLKELKRYDEAFAAYDKALAFKSDLEAAWLGRGNVSIKLKRYDEALAAYDKALGLKPELAEAWLGRGNVFNERKRHDEAFAAYDKAIALKRDLEEAWLGRGTVFSGLKRYDEAFDCYDKALALNPELAEAWLDRGNIFSELKRYDEALGAYDKALVLKPELAEAWAGTGSVFHELKRYDEAFAAFDKALALNPDLAGAWLGRGNVFKDRKRYDEALGCYDKALALKPGLAGAWLGRGNVFNEIKRYDEAFAAYDKALTLNPDVAEAWLGRGGVFNELRRYDEAFEAFDKAFSIKPDLMGLEGARLLAKMSCCNWNNYDAECSHLISSIKNGNVNTPPFSFLAISSSAEEHLRCAKLWAAINYPRSSKPIWRGEQYSHDRIRVAYLSADFRQHPVSLLTAGMFECHNKSHFDITAISIGPDDKSEIRQRLKSSFEHFVDAKEYSDERLAGLVKEMEIDILIDLAGFTDGSRTNVLASRAAPIQINYLGYAGTMGTDFIDYLISDPTIIPLSHKNKYAEKIVHLPNSYMPHDEAGRLISDRSFKRAEFGLPQTGFVFCCFNNSFKFNPDIFDCWARILKAVEGSVLWVSMPSPPAATNLKKEISIRGLNPDRLLFASQLPLMGEHLARIRLADLFLDTLPYNAHTTANDALWAGLPVLTRIGETFAGRVAASLLNALGLPELITTTSKAYEELAIDLATHPEKLAAIKNKLAENRLTTPLFDTKLFTKHIEAAYTAMYERYRAGLPPDHIVIPN